MTWVDAAAMRTRSSTTVARAMPLSETSVETRCVGSVGIGLGAIALVSDGKLNTVYDSRVNSCAVKCFSDRAAQYSSNAAAVSAFRAQQGSSVPQLTLLQGLENDTQRILRCTIWDSTPNIVEDAYVSR